jgi:hypothetical protein
LVDCRNNSLVDGVMSWSVPAQAARSLVPSVKIITGGSAIDSLLSEFPDLTRNTGVQREVRHHTVHHIRTTSGPPVTCRLRRLAPDPLAMAKAEFDAMLRDGTARRSESSWSSALHTVLRRTTVSDLATTTERSTHALFPTAQHKQVPLRKVSGNCAEKLELFISCGHVTYRHPILPLLNL